MNTGNTTNQAPLAKVIYFDEGSATDYIQLFNGGDLKSATELFDENNLDENAETSVRAGFGSRIVRILAGLDIHAEAKGSLAASFNSGTIVKNIISNTVLTDFLNAVEADSSEAIKSFTNYSIEQILGSISSFALLTPYLSMLRGGQGVPAGDFDISIDKLDSTLSKAKGYFEFMGIGRNEDSDEQSNVIFRFNNNAFKNNYRPTDLLKMDLMMYAVRVGSCLLDDLAVDSELRLEGFSAKDNPEYEELDMSATEPDHSSPLEMYDVLLAGVMPNGE